MTKSVPAPADPASADPSSADPEAAALVAPRHSLAEDALGLLTGTFIASFGLFLLGTVDAVTGGTAGLALLVSYAVPLPFGVIFLLINVPFFALALWKKGLNFTLRTVVAVSLVSGFSGLHPFVLDIATLDPVYGVLFGNALIGVGLLILFRHKGSLGGFNILALLLQERFGLRAGYVQMVLDVTVVLVSLAVLPPLFVLLSAGGAILLNLVLAINHRPGRYLGA